MREVESPVEARYVREGECQGGGSCMREVEYAEQGL